MEGFRWQVPEVGDGEPAEEGDGGGELPDSG